ncbi:hypothetical protein ACFX1X_032153 [Malus domestica]
MAEEDFISTQAEDFPVRSLHLLRNLFMVPFGVAKAQFPVSEKGTMLQVVIIDMQITLLNRLLLHRTMPYMSEDWAYCSRLLGYEFRCHITYESHDADFSNSSFGNTITICKHSSNYNCQWLRFLKDV